MRIHSAGAHPVRTFTSKSYARLEARGSAWCMRHPAVTLPVASLLFLAGIYGTSRSSIDPSPETYLFGTELWNAYAKVDRDYNISETAVIALRELGGTVFDVDTVSAVAALDRQLSDMPEVERVLSIASATALDRDSDVLDLAPLLPSGPITRETAIKLATRIRCHPVYGEALVDAGHETTFLFAQISPELKNPIDRIRAVREIRAKGDAFKSKHRTIHFAGSLFTKEAIAVAFQRDTLMFLPAILLVLALMLWLVFGEIVASLVPLAVIGFSSMLALGLLSAAGARLNLTTATVPAVLLVVGLAESIHFLAELRRQHARIGDRESSLIAAIEAVSAPCLLTTVAATLGFLALERSKVEPIRQLGYATAFGLVAIYVSLFFVTPAVLRLLEYPRRGARPFSSGLWIGKSMSRVAAAAHRHVIVTIGAAGLVCGVSIAALSMIRIDSSYIGHLDPEHRLRQDLALIERTLGGVDTVELILDADRNGFFKEISELQALDRLGKALSGSGGVHTAFSLADYLKIANAAMTKSPPGELALPASKEAVAQLMVIDPTPFSAFMTSGMQQARLALQIQSMSSERVLALASAVKEKAEQAFGGKLIGITVTGLPLLYARLIRFLVSDAVASFLLALVLIWAAMMIGLRSAAIGTVAMAPNVLAVLFTLGTVSVLGISLDGNVIFVLSLAIAIAVNHTIHLAARYQRARGEGSPTPTAAVIYAMNHGGHPVVVTSLLLLLGFSVLCASSFNPTHQMGMLGAMLVGFALLLDLTLLPVLLMTADALEHRYVAYFKTPGARASL